MGIPGEFTPSWAARMIGAKIFNGGTIVAKVGELFQSADWKAEKHVPVIECGDEVKADELFEVKVTLGKEVIHPNTTEHHIRWI
jgi:desulfoferrodoxin (superoxide reductase-like protein)